ncbi:MAG: glycosyltransferase [Planctomycetia bacterium]|nr:glycosyltransferase [Planctomycetia bacterium]
MLRTMPTTWLVVPCFNEEQRLDLTAFTSFMRRYPAVRFCFVNDGSRDGTAEVLERLALAAGGRAVVHHLKRNSGKAEAVRRGVLHALAQAPAAFVGYWDADLATPLDELLRFFSAAAEHESVGMLCGSRIRRLGATIVRRRRRHLLGRIFATIASIAIRMPVYDTQCGAKLFESGLARRIFAEPFSSAWCFDVELLARARSDLQSEREIVEVPLLRWEDVAGSKLRPRHFVTAGLDLLRIFIRFRWSSPPVSRRTADFEAPSRRAA